MRIAAAAKTNVVGFDPRTADPGEAVTAMLAPAGNLRAPTLTRGKTVGAGFDEITYDALVG